MTGWTRQRAVWLAGLLVAAAAATAAAGTVTLDQANEGAYASYGIVGYGAGGGGTMWTQTFTAGLTGTLDHVDLYLWRLNGSQTLTVDITGLTAGVPPVQPDATTRLATTDIASTDVPNSGFAWVTIDFSSQHLAVTAGQEFAIVLSTPFTNDFEWGMTSYATGPYAGGQVLYHGRQVDHWTAAPDYDAMFRTYVDVPATGAIAVPVPRSAALGAGLAGSLGLAGWMRRRRDRQADPRRR